MKRTLAIAMVLCLIGCGLANAETFSEDWNSGAGGWYEGSGSAYAIFWASTGGVDDSGCYQGTRNAGLVPCLWPYQPPATTNFTGDLETVYGNSLISISYDVKDFAGTATPGVWHTIYQGGNYWTKQLSETSPAEWTRVSTVIDTTWTDEEANANGWALLGGSGTWAALMDNVQEHWLHHNGLGGPGSGDIHIGVDNLTMSSVPEPSTVILTALAVLGFVGCFRRLS